MRALGVSLNLEPPAIAYYLRTVDGLRFGLWDKCGRFLRSCSEQEFSDLHMDVKIFKASHPGMICPAAHKRQLALFEEREKVNG